jgi:hypothetical protein
MQCLKILQSVTKKYFLFNPLTYIDDRYTSIPAASVNLNILQDIG